MSLTLTRTQQLAKAVAARYKRSSWWADFEDMQQEATVAILRAQETFNPNCGVAEGAYCFRAGLFAVKRYLWENSAPVSGGSHRPEIALAGLTRAPLEACEDFGERELDPESAAYAYVAHKILRARLFAMLDRMPLAPRAFAARKALVDNMLAGDSPENMTEEILRQQLAQRAKRDPVVRRTLHPGAHHAE